MAVDAFLKLDGIAGESQDDKHKGEIDILSFSWGASNVISIGSQSSGSGAGKVSFQDLHITKSTDASSPKLFLNCANGQHISSGVLTIRKAGQDYLKWTLANVLVSSYQSGGDLTDNGYSPLQAQGDNGAVEQVTLNFTKIEIDYTPQQGGPTQGAIISGSWDILQNAPGTSAS